MTARQKLLRTTTALLLPIAFAACDDDDPTGPDGSSGSVSAVMHDGSGASGMTAARAMSGAFSGSASGSAQVWIHSDAQGWIALGSPTNATVQMQSDSETMIHGSATVPAGSYTRVRLVMEGFAADIAAGAVLGGLTLDAAVTITMGGSDGRVEIEKTMTPFTVSASSTTKLAFDLNSEAWVDQQSAESRSAADARIQSATSAYVAS